MFAESFREMLDRNHAFSVYYNLNCALDREAERKRRDEALTAIAEEKLENEEEKPEGEKEEAKEPAKPKETSKEDPRSRFKALINYVNAFTSFAHFDTNIVG